MTEEKTPALLITHCPYCGSQDISELNRIEGHEVESVALFCLTCDEMCVIDRGFNEPGEYTNEP